MVESSRDLLLTALLECGTLDLGVLDRVGYDWCDVLDRAEGFGVSFEKLGFNGLMRLVVDMGIEDLATAIGDRICELKAITNEKELDEDEAEELEMLRLLDPEEDVNAYFNFLDTHAYLQRNQDIYRDYAQDEVKEFEENTGLRMENW